MSAKRRRLSEKEYQRLLQARADEEADARSDSEKRQERIKELWGLITSGKLMQDDESEETARDLQSEIVEEVFGEWKTAIVKQGGSEKRLWQRDRQGTHQRRSSDKLDRSLIELVTLQRDEISYMRPDHNLCKWAKTHAPDEIAALREKCFGMVRAVLMRANKLTPKQASEQRTRSRRPRYQVGLIEYQFGGQADARAGFPLDPDCLDDILMGDGVDMGYLEILFEIERHRFPKKLPSVRVGRKILYGAFAVVKIMDALLKEERAQREPGARGGSEKKLWPSNPDCQERVLVGILYRAYALSRDRHILAAFAAVVWGHLPIEFLKGQLPKGCERLVAALGRRYLD